MPFKHGEVRVSAFDPLQTVGPPLPRPLIQLIVGISDCAKVGQMRRLAELEEMARMAREQALMSANQETREVLLDIAPKYAEAASQRRALLARTRVR